MAEITADCARCPKTLEARSLFRSEHGIRYCFDCPLGFRPSRFEALVKRMADGRGPRIRSCRRATHAGIA
jgi:hypothetical protein